MTSPAGGVYSVLINTLFSVAADEVEAIHHVRANLPFGADDDLNWDSASKDCGGRRLV